MLENKELYATLIETGKKAKSSREYLEPLLNEYEEKILKDLKSASKDELASIQGQYIIISKLKERLNSDISQAEAVKKAFSNK